MKTGIFSGTFDPVHKGHISFAIEAASIGGLDAIHFLIEPNPRRKSHVSDIAHRRAMLERAVQDHPKLNAHLEIDDTQHSVANTLPALKKAVGNNSDLVLLMGADVFEHLPSWPEHDELISQVSFIVALRTEDDGETAIITKQKLPGIDVQFITSPAADISSSKIRQALKQGIEPKGLTPHVLTYAREQHLYEA